MSHELLPKTLVLVKVSTPPLSPQLNMLHSELVSPLVLVIVIQVQVGGGLFLDVLRSSNSLGHIRMDTDL